MGVVGLWRARDGGGSATSKYRVTQLTWGMTGHGGCRLSGGWGRGGWWVSKAFAWLTWGVQRNGVQWGVGRVAEGKGEVVGEQRQKHFSHSSPGAWGDAVCACT